MSTTDVKQSIITADATFKTAIGGTVAIARARVKGVSGLATGANAIIKLYDGSDATGTLKYQMQWGASDGDTWNEYIAEDGILFTEGIYGDVTNCDLATIIFD
jgi:hypothetical protein|tara:strand:- start:933 stop:1241 length:309 start_codon:yes stop_codon:yes gene_type:complete